MLHLNTVQIGMVIGIGIVFFLPVSIFIVVLPALSASQNEIQRWHWNTSISSLSEFDPTSKTSGYLVLSLLAQNKYQGGDGGLDGEAFKP